MALPAGDDATKSRVAEVAEANATAAHGLFLQKLGKAWLDKAATTLGVGSAETPSPEREATGTSTPAPRQTFPNRSRRLQDRASHCASRASCFRDLGRHHLAEAQMVRCRKHAENALEMDWTNVGARFLLVGCLMYQGELALARKEALELDSCLTQAQKEVMGDPVLYLALAHMCRRLGFKEEALKWLRQAADEFPQHPAPCAALSDLLNTEGDYMTSAELAAQALDLDNEPGCPERLTASEKATVACCRSERHVATMDVDKVFEETESTIAESGDTQPEPGDVEHDEDHSGVRPRRSKQARPGGLMRVPAVACPTAHIRGDLIIPPPPPSPRMERAARRRGDGPAAPVGSRSRPFAPLPDYLRKKEAAPAKEEPPVSQPERQRSPVWQPQVSEPGRMRLSKLVDRPVEDNTPELKGGVCTLTRTVTTSEDVGEAKGVLIREHLPKEPAPGELNWACRIMGCGQLGHC
eukprot:TRINITY_DN102438_c0_g1_i1.p1 TRINITY_DN102438_c0_g1~~TRINITY_DN102438_c0_g1_i1.p1  ORF type:complete len:468 (-),score=82.13 TRINITY_DN102438_c0_g1_i1:90-1493(-)